jgi:hypothetical protein
LLRFYGATGAVYAVKVQHAALNKDRATSSSQSSSIQSVVMPIGGCEEYAMKIICNCDDSSTTKDILETHQREIRLLC